MKRAWIGLGGNVGDVRSRMATALQMLSDEGCEITEVSSLYETPPWGPVEQARFLNACAELRTGLEPTALLRLLHHVESRLSRVRAQRWGPRTIDLDLLAYEDFRSDAVELAVPHPRIAERAFVLVPLAEIAPDLEIEGERATDLAARSDRGDMALVAREWVSG